MKLMLAVHITTHHQNLINLPHVLLPKNIKQY